MPKQVDYTCKGMRGWTKKTAERALKARQKAWQDPERRAKRIEALRERDRKSEGLKAWYNRGKNSPEYTAAIKKGWEKRRKNEAKKKQELEEALKLYGVSHPKPVPVSVTIHERRALATELLKKYDLECAPDQTLDYYNQIIKNLNPELALKLKIK